MFPKCSGMIAFMVRSSYRLRWEVAMTLFRFVREIVGYAALLGTVYVWTLLGHAAGF
jgi:hypothetical protein